MEIEKIPTSIRLDFKPLVVNSQACPSWVPMIEAGMQHTQEMHDAVYADLKELLDKDPLIDTIILGCTHYPLITGLIQTVLQELDHPEIILMPQGKPVAYGLQDYLRRHPEMECRLSKDAQTHFFTTGSVEAFESQATKFIGHVEKVKAEGISLSE